MQKVKIHLFKEDSPSAVNSARMFLFFFLTFVCRPLRRRTGPNSSCYVHSHLLCTTAGDHQQLMSNRRSNASQGQLSDGNGQTVPVNSLLAFLLYRKSREEEIHHQCVTEPLSGQEFSQAVLLSQSHLSPTPTLLLRVSVCHLMRRLNPLGSVAGLLPLKAYQQIWNDANHLSTYVQPCVCVAISWGQTPGPEHVRVHTHTHTLHASRARRLRGDLQPSTLLHDWSLI